MPALIPENNYNELTIHNGVDATQSWSEMIQLLQKFDETADSTVMSKILKLSFDLLAYCSMDTLVMVKLFDYLEQLMLRNNQNQLELPITNQK